MASLARASRVPVSCDYDLSKLSGVHNAFYFNYDHV